MLGYVFEARIRQTDIVLRFERDRTIEASGIEGQLIVVIDRRISDRFRPRIEGEGQNRTNDRGRQLLCSIGGAKPAKVPCFNDRITPKSIRVPPGTTASTNLIIFFPSLTITTMHFAACAIARPRIGLTTSVRPSAGWSISRYRALFASSKSTRRS